jgi:Carboxypeptidase regulatory-like domain
LIRVKSSVWKWLLAIAVVWAGLFFGRWGYAQVNTGMVEGTVRDEAGSGVAHAKVTLESETTSSSRSVSTGEDGTYILAPVEVGTYTLTVTTDGFAPEVRKGVTVSAEAHVVADVSLHRTGSGGGEQPASLSPGAGDKVIRARQLAALPLDRRDYTHLARLLPGVTRPQETRHGLGASGSFVANGVRVGQNNYLLDGIENNSHLADDLTGFAFAVQPAADAIQEFTVQSSAYGALAGGGAGAVLNVTTKSGTDQYHGSAWEFYGNDKFDAADFFDNAAQIGKAALHKNQFGLALGGPVPFPGSDKKNPETFFFVDYQGTRIHQGVPETATVPTLAERESGFTNFSDLISAQPGCSRGPDLLGRTISCGTILDPATTRLVLGGGTDPVTGLTGTGTGFVRDPFAGNLIPTNRLDPVAAAILSLYPLPNGSGIYNNYTTNAHRTESDNSFDARLDQNLTSQDRAFVRLSVFDAPSTEAGPFAGVADGGGYTQIARSYNAELSETHVFSATLANQFRAGFSRIHAARVQPYANDLSNIPYQYGIQAIPQLVGNGGLPTLDIGILSPLGSSPFLYANDYDTTWQVSDGVTKQYGAHTIQGGADFQRIVTSTFQPPYSRGLFGFSGNYTSIPNVLDASTGIAQFLTSPIGSTVANGVNLVGGPSQVLASNMSGIEDLRIYAGLYVQDHWRVSPRLTLDLGMRADYFQPPEENFSAEANFIPGTPGSSAQYLIPVGRQQDPLSTVFTNALTASGIALNYTSRGNLVKAKTYNLAPRVGWAYRVSRKLVVRGGVGIYYGSPENAGVLADLGGNYPFQVNYAFTSPTDGAPIIYPFTGANATLEGGLGSVTLDPALGSPNRLVLRGIQQGWKDPYNIGMSLQAAYQLGEQSSVQLAYAGSLGHHLEVNTGLNLPDGILRPGENPQAFVPFPTFAYGSSYLQTQGNSYYHSLQFTYRRNLRHGLSLLADYAYSKTRTDAHDLLFSAGDQPYRAAGISGLGIHYDYGLANFDVRNALHVSGSYALPFGKGKTFLSGGGISNKLAGGWSAEWILTVQSGQPVTIPCTITTAAGEGCYALLTGNATSGAQTVNQYWNPAAFADPAAATSSGQTDLTPLGGPPSQVRGPGLGRLDFALHKDLRASETTHVEFRIEAFNVTNHPNFALPSNLNFSDPASFGQIRATVDAPNDARQIQFAVKFYF